MSQIYKKKPKYPQFLRDVTLRFVDSNVITIQFLDFNDVTIRFVDSDDELTYSECLHLVLNCVVVTSKDISIIVRFILLLTTCQKSRND